LIFSFKVLKPVNKLFAGFFFETIFCFKVLISIVLFFLISSFLNKNKKK